LLNLHYEKQRRLPAALLILCFALLAGCASVNDVRETPDASTLLVQSEQAMDSGDLGAAQYSLGQLLQSSPRNLEALQMLLLLHTTNDNEQGQRAVAGQLLELRPQHGQSLERLGLLALADERLSVAADYLGEAVAAEPERWAAWNGLGIVADARGKYHDAENFFLRGLDVIPGHPRLMANLGWSRLLAGHPQEAEHLLRESAKNAPDDLITRSNLAFSIALQGRYQEAMRLYEGLYRKSAAANNVGYAALLRHDNKTASRYFTDAIKLEPSFYRKAANNLQLVGSLE
jgi:Flp pilus assembly protein TadD